MARCVKASNTNILYSLDGYRKKTALFLEIKMMMKRMFFFLELDKID